MTMELEAYMRGQYDRAKKTLQKTERWTVAIGVLAIATAFLKDGWVVAAWCAGVASLVAAVWQQVLSARFRSEYSAAEEVRRMFHLSDGLGEPVRGSELAELSLRLGESGVRASGQYYTSELEPGLARLLMLTWESAFWSKALQSDLAARSLKWAAGTTAVPAIALAIAFVGPEAAIVPKTAVAVLSLVLALGYWSKWRGSDQMVTVCNSICERCRARLVEGAKSGSEAGELGATMRIVQSYNAASLTACPAPDAFYEARSKELGDSWERVSRDVLAALEARS